MAKNLIELKDVSVSYSSTLALSDVNLSFYKNDFVGVIGPNGGGKTSLIKAILGLIPYTGSIYYTSGLSVNNGTVGYLPQVNDFDKNFPITVSEVVLSGLQAGKHIRFNRQHKAALEVKELLQLVGIYHLRNKPICELSGGELQRALLGRAIICNPRLLILDEPANFVDNKFEKELYEILKLLNGQMAIIMVSHDLGTISSYVKSIVCVNKTAHRHSTSEITEELLENYNCPIQLISHGKVPHTVLKEH